MRFLIIIALFYSSSALSQKPIDYFNKAANQYIDVSKEKALATLNEAIRKYPNDPDLSELKKRLEEEENQDQQNQDQNKEGEQENKENQEGDNQEQSEQEKQDQEQQNQDQKEGEEEEQEKSQEQMTKEKLEEMGISEEKARQLLEAMRQSEIKYLQHQKRKPTKRPPSGKPDW